MISEAALAAQATAWLESEGWDVFSEVQLSHEMQGRHDLGARADLVGQRDGELAVFECKCELSFELFAQAERWTPFANRVWLMVPEAKPSKGRAMALRLARDALGMGVIQFGGPLPVVRCGARLNETPNDALLVSLRPEHKTHAAAGTNRGGQFSSFKATCDALAEYVDRYPGCKLSEALARIPTHYRSKASAEASLSKWIKRGKVPGVFSGWRKGLYSTEEQAQRGAA